jgi:hypothetical protein
MGGLVVLRGMDFENMGILFSFRERVSHQYRKYDKNSIMRI